MADDVENAVAMDIDVDEANLQVRVDEIKRNTISENSRESYASKSVSFIQWLDKNRRNFLNEAFLADAAQHRSANGVIDRKYLKKVRLSPFSFIRLDRGSTHQCILLFCFVRWLHSLQLITSPLQYEYEV